MTPKKSPNFTELLSIASYEKKEEDIVEQFMSYTLQGNDRPDGLIKRSAAEAKLFIEGDYLNNIDDLYGKDAVDIYIDFLHKYPYEGSEKMVGKLQE